MRVILKTLKIERTMLLFDLADVLLENITKEDFIMNNEYKIK